MTIRDKIIKDNFEAVVEAIKKAHRISLECDLDLNRSICVVIDLDGKVYLEIIESTDLPHEVYFGSDIIVVRFSPVSIYDTANLDEFRDWFIDEYKDEYKKLLFEMELKGLDVDDFPEWFSENHAVNPTIENAWDIYCNNMIDYFCDQFDPVEYFGMFGNEVDFDE